MTGRSLITISDLSREDITAVFNLAGEPDKLISLPGRPLSASCSFEGNSIRTRATFLKVLADLNITAVDVPNLLKTDENPRHLAGYLDNWFDLYIIRARNHGKLAAFADCSARPVINAMTAEAHPCEVLADLYSVLKERDTLDGLSVTIIGPPTNVLLSWHDLALLMGLNLTWVLPESCRQSRDIRCKTTPDKAVGLVGADIILTDAWPEDFNDMTYQLQMADLNHANPGARVIPCPPFDTEREIHPSVIDSPLFAGYTQKKFLYDIHKALIVYLLKADR